VQVFTREELEMVSELCVRHNVLCMSDEVYEWLVYPPMSHIKIGTVHSSSLCLLHSVVQSPFS